MSAPKTAGWLVRRFGAVDPALLGDLLEEFQSGRSGAWFWRQSLWAIATGARRNARKNVRFVIPAACGWALQAAAVILLSRLGLFRVSHSAAWRVSAEILLIGGLLLLVFLRTLVLGRPRISLARACRAGSPAPGAWRTSIEVAYDTFETYLFCYFFCVFLAGYADRNLIFAEPVWLAMALSPALIAGPPRKHA